MKKDVVVLNRPWSLLWRGHPCSPFSVQLNGWSGRRSASDSAAPVFQPGLCSTQFLKDKGLTELHASQLKYLFGLPQQGNCTLDMKEPNWWNTSVKGLDVLQGLVNSIHLVTTLLQDGTGTEHCSVGLHSLYEKPTTSRQSEKLKAPE